MTDVQETITRVESSPEFKAWAQDNESSKLVHVFATVTEQPTQSREVELGYYSTATETITVFTTAPVTRLPEQEVFKHDEHPAPAPLNLSAAILGLTQALEIVEATRQTHYARHPVMKCICVLQQQQVPLWSVTIVTATLQMLTMRIDASSGEVLSHELQSLMSLVKEA